MVKFVVKILMAIANKITPNNFCIIIKMLLLTTFSIRFEATKTPYITNTLAIKAIKILMSDIGPEWIKELLKRLNRLMSEIQQA